MLNNLKFDYKKIFHLFMGIKNQTLSSTYCVFYYILLLKIILLIFTTKLFLGYTIFIIDYFLGGMYANIFNHIL